MAITGELRCGPRTKDLAKLITPGQIAVIAHDDLDRVAAESLVQAKVAAVINVRPSITLRYPNGGPSVLEKANIPLVDCLGMELEDIESFRSAKIDIENKTVEFEADDSIEKTDIFVWSRSEIEKAMETARNNIGNELRAFATNTLEYIDKEVDEFF